MKKKLVCYIASSWKNRHGVEMLTEKLREMGFEVKSFIENNFGEAGVSKDGSVKNMPFDQWVWSAQGEKAFSYDTMGAMYSDLVIYYGPSGIDAWAEVGCAYATGKAQIIGLQAKDEAVGLMRRLVSIWYTDHRELLRAVKVAYGPIIEKGTQVNIEELEKEFPELKDQSCGICNNPLLSCQCNGSRR